MDDAINVLGKHIHGNARVYGNAEVCGNACISAGNIFGEARIGSKDDLVQVVIGSDVWSRFRTVDGYATTCTNQYAHIPAHVEAFFDAWEASRG